MLKQEPHFIDITCNTVHIVLHTPYVGVFNCIKDGTKDIKVTSSLKGCSKSSVINDKFTSLKVSLSYSTIILMINENPLYATLSYTFYMSVLFN